MSKRSPKKRGNRTKSMRARASPSQTTEFDIEPPLLHWFLSPKQSNRSVVLVSAEPDFLDKKKLRVNLDVAFERIAVTYGRFRRTSCYVAATEVDVSVESANGRVTDASEARALTAQYSVTKEYQRLSSVKLTPKLTLKAKPVEASAEIGSICRQSGLKQVYNTKFERSERQLMPVRKGREVQFHINQPHKNRVPDYLLGNLYLFAEFSQSQRPVELVLTVRALDVRFYSSTEAVVSFWRATMTHFLLWRDGLSPIPGRSGMLIKIKQRVRH